MTQQEIKEVKLSEFLVNNSIITQDQLNQALDYQTQHGGKISEILIITGIISEDKFLASLRYHLGVPVIDLEKIRIPEAIVKLIPKKVVEKYKVIPVKIHKADKKTTLYLAMADPLDLHAISEVEFITGLKVEPVLCTEKDMHNALGLYYDVDVFTTPTEGEDIASETEIKPDTTINKRIKIISGAVQNENVKKDKSVELQSYFTSLSKERTLIQAMIKILVRKGLVTSNEIEDELNIS